MTHAECANAIFVVLCTVYVSNNCISLPTVVYCMFNICRPFLFARLRRFLWCMLNKWTMNAQKEGETPKQSVSSSHWTMVTWNAVFIRVIKIKLWYYKCKCKYKIMFFGIGKNDYYQILSAPVSIKYWDVCIYIFPIYLFTWTDLLIIYITDVQCVL